MNPVLSWQEHGEHRSAAWRSESRHQPPQRIEAVAQISAEQALSLMHQNTALLWRGDYHQGKQLLAAIKKRISDELLEAGIVLRSSNNEQKEQK